MAVFFKVSPDQNLYAPNGFSLQLNAVPPPNSQNITWMQYIFAVNVADGYGNSANGNVEYWGNLTNQNTPNGGCIAFSNQDLNVNCCGNGDCCSGWDSFWDPIFGGGCQTQMPNFGPDSGTLSAGYEIAIVLITGGGNVTAALFEVWDNNGVLISSFTVPIPGYLQVPVQAFQFVAVGESGGANTQFSSGGGTITYSVASGQELCVDGGAISCPKGAVYSGSTGETSNAKYGTMNNCCGNTLTQSLTVPQLKLTGGLTAGDPGLNTR